MSYLKYVLRDFNMCDFYHRENGLPSNKWLIWLQILTMVLGVYNAHQMPEMKWFWFAIFYLNTAMVVFSLLTARRFCQLDVKGLVQTFSIVGMVRGYIEFKATQKRLMKDIFEAENIKLDMNGVMSEEFEKAKKVIMLNAASLEMLQHYHQAVMSAKLREVVG